MILSLDSANHIGQGGQQDKTCYSCLAKTSSDV